MSMRHTVWDIRDVFHRVSMWWSIRASSIVFSYSRLISLLRARYKSAHFRSLAASVFLSTPRTLFTTLPTPLFLDNVSTAFSLSYIEEMILHYFVFPTRRRVPWCQDSAIWTSSTRWILSVASLFTSYIMYIIAEIQSPQAWRSLCRRIVFQTTPRRWQLNDGQFLQLMSLAVFFRYNCWCCKYILFSFFNL